MTALRSTLRPVLAAWRLWPVLAAVALAACDAAGETVGEARPPAPVPVRVVALAPAEPAPLRLPAVLRAERELALAFRIGGEIASREVRAGQRVRAGEVLLRLDARELERALEAAEAAVAAARAEAELARSEAARREELGRRRVIAVEDAERARALAEAARERLREAQARLELARLDLEHATLRAPADGIVSEVLGEVHEVVTAGRVVVTLALDGPREAELFVPETRRAALAAAPRLRAFRPGLEEPVTARLRELSAAAEPKSRTFRARLRLEGVPEDAPVGTSLLVELREPAPDLRQVPLAALVAHDRDAALWVVRDGRVEPRPVRVVRVVGEAAWVETDLAAGTLVVAAGTHRLHANDPVRVVP